MVSVSVLLWLRTPWTIQVLGDSDVCSDPDIGCSASAAAATDGDRLIGIVDGVGSSSGVHGLDIHDLTEVPFVVSESAPSIGCSSVFSARHSF